MMRTRMLALAALVMLGGCHRKDDAAGALDAGADARARTAAKTNADLAAADAASRTALPRPPVARAERAEASTPSPGQDEDVNRTDADRR